MVLFPTTERHERHPFCSPTSSLILYPFRQNFFPGSQVLLDPSHRPPAAPDPRTQAYPFRNAHSLQTTILATRVLSADCPKASRSVRWTFSLSKTACARLPLAGGAVSALYSYLCRATSAELLCPLASGEP